MHSAGGRRRLREEVLHSWRAAPIQQSVELPDFLTDLGAWPRSVHSPVQGDESGKTCSRLPISSGSKEDQGSATTDHTVETVVSDDEGDTWDTVLLESRHRDGSIYRDMYTWWKRDYCIADRSETRVKLSDPSDCKFFNGSKCVYHVPSGLMQIFSLELAKLPVDGGSVELYGYVAVRDDVEPLLNYVVNISRDDPVTVEEGSIIKVSSPKRGIYMMDLLLLEYDMRIKTGEQEKHDLPLIDGASLVGRGEVCNDPTKFPISSDRGAAVNITQARFGYAVEATIEVLVSEVRNRFSLSLGCFTSGLSEKIFLFDGAIAESCGPKRYVVAVTMDSLIDLKFEVGAMPSGTFDQHCCSFKSKTHGHDTLDIKTDFAIITVKLS